MLRVWNLVPYLYAISTIVCGAVFDSLMTWEELCIIWFFLVVGCVGADDVKTGYYKNLQATEATIDKEGWLHTGDVGYIDDDGDIFVVDRVKELIKYKGFQVLYI